MQPNVTILLLSRNARGNGSRLLREQVSVSCTKRSGDTISSESTELAWLSLRDLSKDTMSSDCMIGRLSCLIVLLQ